MNIKFDAYFEQNLGTPYKTTEINLKDMDAVVNVDLQTVKHLEVNFEIEGQVYTDAVKLVDASTGKINIPIKQQVLVLGKHKFEIVAYMQDGSKKVSQTYLYSIIDGIGEGNEITIFADNVYFKDMDNFQDKFDRGDLKGKN